MNKMALTDSDDAAELSADAPEFPGDRPKDNASQVEHDAWRSAFEVWREWRLIKLSSCLVWTKSDSPQLISNTSNAAAFLRLHPDWHNVMAYDEFRHTALLTGAIPGTPEALGRFEGRAVSDTDFAAAQEWFQKNGMPRMPKQAVADAMDLVCHENKADPLRQHVEECARNWDGTNRIHRLFQDYFVATEQNAYTKELGEKVLMTLVLRALHPGAFQKMVPILEGKQDIGKSKGIAALCPNPEWFGDSLPTIHSKDASSYLRGMFIVEIAELSATKRADIDDLKSFITRSVERYRPAYGRKEVEEPRRCMFWGTTNRNDYLRDETGNCRFYPVSLVAVNVNNIAVDRDQLLGEAAHLLKEALQSNASWWEFSEAATAILESERRARDEDHPWTGIVLRYVENLDEVAIPAILEASEHATPSGLGIARERYERKHSMAVAGILKAHDWVRSGKFTSGNWKGQARYVRGV
ncbi:VapE domain-containing protein [Roseovarius sp.]|uniref:VapE domain-containing protein n=1 Tax=Roseovarius sp. TaxID=1486281 RepID=UPI003A972D6C